MNSTLFFGGVCLSLCFCACSVYRNSPIDLNAEETNWKAISRAISPANITQNQARIIGLLLNTELNKARIKLASSTEVAKQAGWWNDPAFSFGTEKILQENVYNVSGNLGFTIPLSGLPGLEKEVAKLYNETNFWTLLQTELDFLSSLDQAWAQLSILQERKKLIQERLETLKEENSRLEQLSKAGEIEFSVLQTEIARMNNAMRELQAVTESELEQRSELIKLMGLHPTSLQLLTFSTDQGFNLPSNVPVPTPSELLESPQIKAQLASYAIAETQLKTEIRRQYPELELGPVFKREDGEKEIGGDIGFNIPLWNRNRKAIAEAQGSRDLSKLETIQVWKDKLHNAQQLNALQRQAFRQGKADLQRIRSYSDSLQTTEKLYRIGETPLTELAENRHQLYESRLSFLDNLEKLLTIQSQIRYLIPTRLGIK